ncbi:hypothetical protein CHUAL_003590 [Chamberlinius hualienensis]
MDSSTRMLEFATFWFIILVLSTVSKSDNNSEAATIAPLTNQEQTSYLQSKITKYTIDQIETKNGTTYECRFDLDVKCQWELDGIPVNASTSELIKSPKHCLVDVSEFDSTSRNNLECFGVFGPSADEIALSQELLLRCPNYVTNNCGWKRNGEAVPMDNINYKTTTDNNGNATNCSITISKPRMMDFGLWECVEVQNATLTNKTFRYFDINTLNDKYSQAHYRVLTTNVKPTVETENFDETNSSRLAFREDSNTTEKYKIRSFYSKEEILNIVSYKCLFAIHVNCHWEIDGLPVTIPLEFMFSDQNTTDCTFITNKKDEIHEQDLECYGIPITPAHETVSTNSIRLDCPSYITQDCKWSKNGEIVSIDNIHYRLPEQTNETERTCSIEIVQLRAADYGLWECIESIENKTTGTTFRYFQITYVDKTTRATEILTTNAKPTIKKDKPTIEEDKPTITEVKPNITEDKPTITEDKPNITEDNSTIKEDKPTIKEDKPTIKEDKPTIKEDKPTIKEDKLVTKDNTSIDGQVDILRVNSSSIDFKSKNIWLTTSTGKAKKTLSALDPIIKLSSDKAKHPTVIKFDKPGKLQLTVNSSKSRVNLNAFISAICGKGKQCSTVNLKITNNH